MAPHQVWISDLQFQCLDQWGTCHTKHIKLHVINYGNDVYGKRQATSTVKSAARLGVVLASLLGVDAPSRQVLQKQQVAATA